MPFLKKNFFKFAGTLIFFIALSVIGLSVYLFSNPGVEYEEKAVEKFAYEQCKKESVELGYAVTVHPKSKYLILKNVGLEDWKEELAKSSIVIERCKGFTLREYCMGESCRAFGDKEPMFGITFALKPAKKVIIK